MRRQHLAAFHGGIELAALLLETAPAPPEEENTEEAPEDKEVKEEES